MHGLSNAFLRNMLTFDEIADDRLDLFEGAQIVAHNAAFDVGFINAELAIAALPPLTCPVVCSMVDQQASEG